MLCIWPIKVILNSFVIELTHLMTISVLSMLV